MAVDHDPEGDHGRSALALSACLYFPGCLCPIEGYCGREDLDEIEIDEDDDYPGEDIDGPN